MPDHISIPYEEGLQLPHTASGAPGDNCRDFRAASISSTNSDEPTSDTVTTFEAMGYKVYDSEAIPKTQARVSTSGSNSGLMIDDVDPGTNKGSDLK
jgi:hypothetical protein